MHHDVFISYTSHDKPAADAVCHALEAHGIRCWIAPRDIPLGANYAETLINAIRAAKLMVLIFSGNTNNSRHVRNEVERAFDQDIAVIPFRIEDTKATGALEYFLSMPHWLDAFTPPLQQHLHGLADSVSALLMAQHGTKPAGSESPPAIITPVLPVEEAPPLPPEKPPPVAAPIPVAAPVQATAPMVGEPENIIQPAKAGNPERGRKGLFWKIPLALVVLAAAWVIFGILTDRRNPPQYAAAPPNTPPLTVALPAAPAVEKAAVSAPPAPGSLPESGAPFPEPKPNRQAALALLNEGEADLNDDQKDDRVKLNIAMGRNALGLAYLDIGERLAAVTQANKAVGLALVPDGDWFRNGNKISILSNAANILWRGGGREGEARFALNKAASLWQSSLHLDNKSNNEWIYGMRLIDALVTQGDLPQAQAVYAKLDQLAEHNAHLKGWSTDNIMRNILGMGVYMPINLLARQGQEDAAFTLALSLNDPYARIMALSTLLGRLPAKNRCDLGPQVAAPYAEAVAGDADNRYLLIELATAASECQIKDVTLNAIDRSLARQEDLAERPVEFLRLAYAAARIGDTGKANDLLDKANAALEKRKSDAIEAHKNPDSDFVDLDDSRKPEDCTSIDDAFGPVARLGGFIKVYGALHDYERAAKAADNMLDQAKNISAPEGRLACMTLTAETLLDAKMWRQGKALSLEAFQSLLAVGPLKADRQQVPIRIAQALGKTGNFAEADKALTFVRDKDIAIEGTRRSLAVMAVRMGNRAAADELVAPIGRTKMEYIYARVDMARALAGLAE